MPANGALSVRLPKSIHVTTVKLYSEDGLAYEMPVYGPGWFDSGLWDLPVGVVRFTVEITHDPPGA